MDKQDHHASAISGTHSIVCSTMPDALFEEDAAIEHFEKFGEISKIVLQPKKQSCIITYETRESANKAVLNAGAYDGFMFDVRLNKKKRQPKKSNDPEWVPDPEVAAELAAMNGNISIPRLNRQQKMELDKPSPIFARKKPLVKKTIIKNPEKKKIKPANESYGNKPSVFSKPIIVNNPTETVDEDEIKNLLNKTWTTIEEKLTALEMRNKIVRKHLQKRQGAIQGCCPDMCPERERLLRQSQRQFSSYECGQSNNFDSKYAIKEYSRSSADQEEPLPHELRPVPVLQRTLLYLLEYIAELNDKPETSLADWFHFMWDRLRGIRKDITQQALCCEGSLSLVEACARFHAHCAARLIEEPPSSFDQRLNTENLSKCLQSLKYMYNDLRNRGESDACKHEPEFRAYVILLQMNDANFMWEVQRLASDVQSSPEVSFAIKIFTALDNDNYIKFFKLVKQTTYLNACILHRYFTDIRIRALQRMIKAYSPRGVAHFPAEELMDMLAFENIESMEYFLDHHGLPIIMKGHSQWVILDKNTFRDNIAPYPQERAYALIESKRNCPLGDIIFGSKLPSSEFEDYVPHTSFDKNNKFKYDALLAEDQGNLPSSEVSLQVKRIIDNINKPGNQSYKPENETKNPLIISKNHSFIFAEPKKLDMVTPLKTNQPTYGIPKENIFTETSVSANKPESNSIFGKPLNIPPFQSQRLPFGGNIFERPQKNVFDSKIPTPSNIFATAVSQSNFSTTSVRPASVFASNKGIEANIFSQKNTPASANIFGNSVSTIPVFAPVDKTVQKEVEAKRQQAEEKRMKEEKRLREIKEEELRNQERLKAIELEKKALEEARIKKETENQENERKDKEFKEYVERYSNVILPTIIDETVDEMSKIFIEDEMKIFDDAKESSICIYDTIFYEICEEECTSSLKDFMKLREIRTRLLMRLVLHRWKAMVLKSRRRHILLMNTPSWTPSRSPPPPSNIQDEVLKRMRSFHRGNPIILKVPKEQKINAIDVFNDVKKYLLRRSQEMDRRSFSFNVFWKVVISGPSKTESSSVYDLFQTWIRAAFIDFNKYNTYQLYLKEGYWSKQFNISICKLLDNVGLNEIGNLRALLGTNGFLFYGNSTHSDCVLKRIESVVLSKNEYECLPIALILHSQKDEFASIKKQLLQYEGHRLISSFKIFVITEFSPNLLSLKTKEALKWLAGNFPPKPPLEINTLHSFLDQCLGHELWCRLKLGLTLPIRNALQNSKTVIGIYNEAVEKIIQLACNIDLQKYPVFAEEFQKYLTVKASYPKDYEYFPSNWKTNTDSLRSLLNDFKMPDYYHKWPPRDWQYFQSSIRDYITHLKWFNDTEQVCLKIMSRFTEEYLNVTLDNTAGFESEYSAASWLNIMEAIVVEKINKISTNQNDSAKVVYKKNDLSAYRTTPWWYRSAAVKDICSFIKDEELTFLDDTLDSLGISSSKKAKMDSTIESMPDNEWFSTIVEDLENQYHHKKVCSQVISELEKTVQFERERQNQIEQLLKSALEEF